jgi:formylglycine-generating enzyme
LRVEGLLASDFLILAVKPFIQEEQRMKTKSVLMAMIVLLMMGTLMATLVAGGPLYAATDLGGTAAYAVDGQIAVGPGLTNQPLAWDLSQSPPLQVNLPLDPSKYDIVAGGMAVSGNIVVGTAQGSSGFMQDVVAWDVSNINSPQSIDLVSCLSVCSPFGPPEYLGFQMSVGTAVSGNVIVGTVFDWLGTQHAVAWDVTNRQAPVAKNLGTLGGTYGWPYAVSGTIVVGESEITRTIQNENAPRHAFAYDLAAPSPQMIDLHPSTSYFSSSASAVCGTLAVGVATTESYVNHAYAWDFSTSPPTIIDLDPSNAYSSSSAYAVSGTIAVGYVDAGSGINRAVAWDLSNLSSPIMHNLGTLTGGTYSYAQAVSGTIVVGQADDASGNLHAFAYDLAAPSPQMNDLGTLGGLNSSALAISGNFIVGQADTTSETHAAFWLLEETPAVITIDTVAVGNPGNAADATGYGAVGYNYRIGKYEVTAGQYTEFLNAKAKTDTYGLYNELMSGDMGCNIQRSGNPGSYTYSVAPESAKRPVNWVSFWDACRFANWISNGQGTGDTETGAYTLNGYNDNDGRTIQRNARNTGWTWAVTSEDEWYKAAYYNPAAHNYFLYPTASNTAPGRDMADPLGNNANYFGDGDPFPIDSGTYYTTIAGEFENSMSGYGTFDQGGNVWEWNETITEQGEGSAYRRLRGGSFLSSSYYDEERGELHDELLASFPGGSREPTAEDGDFGFRVSKLIADTSVTLVPERLNVTRGSSVTVSVDMTVLPPGITMAAISTNILYDPKVFTFDEMSVVVQGGLLSHTWSLYGGTSPLGDLIDLRVGGIIFEEPWFDDLAAGSGTLLTFTLKVKETAPQGPSALTWGVYDGNNATAGFDYGDADFNDVVLPESALANASITVVGEIPTAITLASFQAKPGSNSVTLVWTTETEIDNAGFNILRAEAENGPYVKINSDIIPAKAGAAQGAVYQFIDTTAKNRTTYYYKLQDISLNGSITDHGPVSAMPRLIFGLGK